MLVALSGIGPLSPWRRATAANLRRNFAVPVGGGARRRSSRCSLVRRRARAAEGARCSPCVVAFVLAGVGAGAVARHARAAGDRRASRRRSRSSSLVRRNRRRYGGYVVHAGFAVLLLGVAISSSFQHAQDVTLQAGADGARSTASTSATCARRARRRGGEDLARRGARRHQGRQARRDAAHDARLLPLAGPVARHRRALLRRRGGERGRPARRLRARHLDGDRRPTSTPLQPIIDEGNRTFAEAMRAVADEAATSRHAVDAAVRAARRGGRRRSRDASSQRRGRPTSASSSRRCATWIWIGAIIVFLRRPDRAVAGARDARGGASRAGYAARVARELARVVGVA